ncbi:MAG: pyruvate/2-oxoglutarate dehydrogenase complex dihydrolipoamide dehydrogenase (E3) component [Polaribacter sp.]|jgi:pyruvate/2-oxoglutarate dehydrogenase complex dihydrolipoamide dehydrogenase (E3) component
MSENSWTQVLPELLPEFTTGKDGTKHYSSRTQKLFDIIENGLPEHGHRRSVAVIGAGMSDMVAASLLKDAGYEVQIFEANTRAREEHPPAILRRTIW